jgi:hypothetical protein
MLQQHQHIILYRKTLFWLLRLHFKQKDLVPYGFCNSANRWKQPQWQLLLPLSSWSHLHRHTLSYIGFPWKKISSKGKRWTDGQMGRRAQVERSTRTRAIEPSFRIDDGFFLWTSKIVELGNLNGLVKPIRLETLTARTPASDSATKNPTIP